MVGTPSSAATAETIASTVRIRHQCLLTQHIPLPPYELVGSYEFNYGME